MKGAELFGFTLGILAIIVGGPLLTIWALNTLFSLSIAYNLATWAAAFWLTALFAAKVKTNK